MPRNKELTVDVASRISDILEEYPAGPAILREILQNTDDAGGRVQVWLYVAGQSTWPDSDGALYSASY